MSHKTSIAAVKHTGAPVYLGSVNGQGSWSANPYTILEWLGDSWRTRYNQHRSKRSKYVVATLPDGSEHKVLVPIGSSVTDIKDSQARKDYSYLASVPSMILQSAERIEDGEWWASIKRRKKSGGAMPRFRSRKLNDNTFTCWFNGGANAKYERTGKRTGVVTIRGQNSSANSKPGHKSRWTLKIRVRHTGRDIEGYTSVQINVSTMTALFTSEPKSLTRSGDGTSIGVDRGGSVAVATSDGRKLSPDKGLTDKWDSRQKYHQAVMGKMRARAEKQGSKPAMYRVMGGAKYQHHKKMAANYAGKIARYREAWQHEVTTSLIRASDRIVLEDLNVKAMTRGGGSRKKGMNRSFLAFSPARFQSMLEYKTLRAGGELVIIPAAYTSQRCNECGYTSKDNRESQADFLCRGCGHTGNADVNAAMNINDYVKHFEGTDLPAVPSGQNGSGAIVRLNPSSEDVSGFYIREPADRNDAINPSTLNQSLTV